MSFSQRFKVWPLWKKILLIFTIVVAAVVTVAVVAAVIFFTWFFQDRDKALESAVKKCGHYPYRTVQIHEGVAEYDLVTTKEVSSNNISPFPDSYYCSLGEAQSNGIHIVSVDGKPIR